MYNIYQMIIWLNEFSILHLIKKKLIKKATSEIKQK